MDVVTTLDLLAVLIQIRIAALITMADVKAEAKAVEGAKQVSWFDLRSFDPTFKDLRKFVRLMRRLMRRLLFPIHNIDSKPKSSMSIGHYFNFYDLSVASTKTKYMKVNTKTQNIFCRLNENLTTFYTL